MKKHTRSSSNGTLPLRLLVFGMIWLVIGAGLFLIVLPNETLAFNSKTQTSVADFNNGTFYRTGLTLSPIHGGDGDGEVRLQTRGISSNSWYSNVSASGLPGIYGHAAAFYNNRIYVAGGSTDVSANGTRDVFYTTVNTTTHNISDWVHSSNSLPYSPTSHALVTVNGFLYAIGGFTPDASDAVTNVVFSKINSDGTLTAWANTGSLPDGRVEFGTAVVSDTIYVLGGTKTGGPASLFDTIYYAKPDPSTGQIAPAGWQTATAHLARAVHQHSAAGYNGAVYAIGGTNNTTFFPNVDYGIISGSGNIASSPLISTSVLQNNRALATAVSFGGQLYVIGGATAQGANPVNVISSNLIEPDHTITNTLAWADDAVLSAERQRTAAIVTNDGWIYVVGGYVNGGLLLNSVDYGPTSSNGAAYVPAGTFTSDVIDTKGTQWNTLYDLKWNAFVSNTVSMTLQYRIGNSLDLSNVAWSSPYYATTDPNVPVTNTVNINQFSRYIQYRVNLSTSSSSQSPVLNAVQIDYDFAPDLTVESMDLPSITNQTVTQTLNVYVRNSISGGPVNRPVLAGKSVSLATRPSPRQLNSPAPSRFFVDLYIDQTPPTNVSTTGDCYGYGPQFSISPGDLVKVIIDHRADTNIGCPITSGKHTFYVQVDTCDLGDAPNDCNNPSNYVSGYVREFNEANNVGGPFYSLYYNIQLPLIFR